MGPRASLWWETSYPWLLSVLLAAGDAVLRRHFELRFDVLAWVPDMIGLGGAVAGFIVAAQSIVLAAATTSYFEWLRQGGQLTLFVRYTSHATRSALVLVAGALVVKTAGGRVDTRDLIDAVSVVWVLLASASFFTMWRVAEHLTRMLRENADPDRKERSA